MSDSEQDKEKKQEGENPPEGSSSPAQVEPEIEQKESANDQEAAPASPTGDKAKEEDKTEDTSAKKKKQGGGSCFAKRKPTPKKTLYDSWTSYEVEPGVRANTYCKTLNNGELIEKPTDPPGMNTLWDMFTNGRRLSAKEQCVGWRVGKTYKWMTYDEVHDKVKKVAAALKNKTDLERQERVGIYAKTQMNWSIVSLATVSRSLIQVPLYDTLGAESCNYIINQSEMKLIFVDTSASAKKIVDHVDSTPCLKTIVIFEEPEEELSKLAEEKNVTLVTLDKFIATDKDDKEAKAEDEGEKKEDEQEEGKEEEKKEQRDDDEKDPFDLPSADDIFIIMYTSGTTGDPKGVVHRHSNVVADLTGVDSLMWTDFGPGLRFSKNDVALCYLPLAHIYGLLVVYWFWYRGASNGFFGGNILNLSDDAQALKPTFIPLVPRLMNRIYGKVMGEINKGGIKKKLFDKGYAKKKALLQQGVITKSTFWDKLVFKKLQALFGGRVWFMSVGSAPVSAEVLEFFRICFGAVIVEGYGQTECAAASNLALGPVGGNVGHPLPCNMIKLVDVADSDYKASEGKGEVCIKGANLMVEYYKQPEKTKETIDEDGWLHTGDVGMWLEDGSLKIIDRTKHIFKLSQGEYIAPEKIENVYVMCPRVAQCFVDGSSLQNYVVGIVVPEPTLAEEWAKKNKVEVADLPNNQDFINSLLEDMKAVGKTQKLNSLEQVKSIFVTSEMFSVENELLTPTMKNKRPALRKRFEAEIAKMYEDAEKPDPQ